MRQQPSYPSQESREAEERILPDSNLIVNGRERERRPLGQDPISKFLRGDAGQASPAAHGYKIRDEGVMDRRADEPFEPSR